VPELAGIARLFPWHGKQKLAAERLWKYLSQDDSSATTIAKQRTYVLRLSHALICQELYGQPFASAVVHFLAALSIHPETSRLLTATEFSPMLGSLVYCIRALTIELFLPAEKRAEQGAAEIDSFLKQRARYLTDGSYSPMSTMLSLLAYAKFIALRTPGSIAGSMWWSVDQQTFYIKGRPVVLQRFRELAQGVITEAERVLWEELLWMSEQEHRPTTRLAEIQDDVSIQQRGVCYLSPSQLEQGQT
jgi:hypothetical protein